MLFLPGGECQNGAKTGMGRGFIAVSAEKVRPRKSEFSAGVFQADNIKNGSSLWDAKMLPQAVEYGARLGVEQCNRPKPKDGQTLLCVIVCGSHCLTSLLGSRTHEYAQCDFIAKQTV